MHEYFSHHHLYHPDWLPRGSTFAAAANIASATIGVGTLSMPYAAHSCGLLAFVALVGLTFGLTIWAIYILCRLVDVCKVHSFEMLSRKIFDSHKVEIFVEIFIVLNCFGTAISYVVVIGDVAEAIVAPSITALSSGVVRLIFQFLLFAPVMLPLSMLRTMGALKYASTVGVIAISVLVVFVTSQGLYGGSLVNLQPPVLASMSSLFGGVPLLFFAYGNQINAIEIYSELKGRTPRQYAMLCSIAVGIVTCAFIAVGVAGLSKFGGDISGNVLKNFSVANPVAAISMFGVGLKVILSFPLLIFPCREALLHLFGIEDVRGAPALVFGGTTTLVSCTAFIIAVFVPGIIVLFGLIGSICAGLFGFILPSLLTFHSQQYWATLKPPMRHVHQAINGSLFAIGITVGIAGTVASLSKLVA